MRASGPTPPGAGSSDVGCASAYPRGRGERFARGRDRPKASRRDLATLLAGQGSDATTVAGTMILAHAVGIAVFATGGLGGMHRDVAESFDISADLAGLLRTPVAVFCSGAKSILDLLEIREALEVLGVPVLGFGCDHLPAFHVPCGGRRCGSAAEVAGIVAVRRAIVLGRLVVGVPVPAEEALSAEDQEKRVARACADAARDGVVVKAITPYWLKRLAELSDGATLSANIAPLRNNARRRNRDRPCGMSLGVHRIRHVV